MSAINDTSVSPPASVESVALSSDDLTAQCDALQQELAAQRALLVKEWRKAPEENADETRDNGRFPRSATMRFLSGRKTTNLVSKLIMWQIGRRYAKFAFWKK